MLLTSATHRLHRGLAALLAVSAAAVAFVAFPGDGSRIPTANALAIENVTDRIEGGSKESRRWSSTSRGLTMKQSGSVAAATVRG